MNNSGTSDDRQPGLKFHGWLHHVVTRLKFGKPIQAATFAEVSAERKNLDIVFNKNTNAAGRNLADGIVRCYDPQIRPIWKNAAPDRIDVDICASGIPNNDEEQIFFRYTISDIIVYLFNQFGCGQELDLHIIFPISNGDPVIDEGNNEREAADKNAEIIADQLDQRVKKCQVIFHTGKYAK